MKIPLNTITKLYVPAYEYHAFKHCVYQLVYVKGFYSTIFVYSMNGAYDGCGYFNHDCLSVEEATKNLKPFHLYENSN